jgi:aryl-alcohol dehydrogenase-like predicted oxidoreductase
VLGFAVAHDRVPQDRPRTRRRILNFLLDRGVNLIDTAASYPGSEEVIAETIGHRRDQIVLVSKCGQKVEASAAKTGRRRSSRRRSTVAEASEDDRLDVMLLHSCKLEVLQKGERWRRWPRRATRENPLRRLQRRQRRRRLCRDLARHRRGRDVDQHRDQVNIATLLPVAKEHNVGVLAKRPIANAAWKDRRSSRAVSELRQALHERLQKMDLRRRTSASPAAEEDGRGWRCASRSASRRCTARSSARQPGNAQKNIDYAPKVRCRRRRREDPRGVQQPTRSAAAAMDRDSQRVRLAFAGSES